MRYFEHNFGSKYRNITISCNLRYRIVSRDLALTGSKTDIYMTLGINSNAKIRLDLREYYEFLLNLR